MRISDWSSDVCSSDLGDARIDEKELIAKHAMGYPAAIDAGALTVMASFSSWRGVKHHGNKGLLTNALKTKIGFEGFVVGDWNGHGKVPGCSAHDCAQSTHSAHDLHIAPDHRHGPLDTTLQQSTAGTHPVPRHREHTKT